MQLLGQLVGAGDLSRARHDEVDRPPRAIERDRVRLASRGGALSVRLRAGQRRGQLAAPAYRERLASGLRVDAAPGDVARADAE